MHSASSFLNLVPDEAKSSYQSADSEYDTYLRDARRQFSEVCAHCVNWGWPTEAVRDDEYLTESFYEGAFLSVLLDKMARMLDQVRRYYMRYPTVKEKTNPNVRIYQTQYTIKYANGPFFQFKGKLAHNCMTSHLVFISCLLDMIKKSITEKYEKNDIICCYRDK